MNIEEKFRNDVKRLISIHANLPANIDRILEKPPQEIGSDLALPCFYLAGTFKKDPRLIAIEVAEKIKPDGLVREVKPIGAYVNFYIDWDRVNQLLIEEILDKDGRYGCSDMGKGLHIMVEYSSPNTNKPLHLGHLRNDSIGMAVSNILSANGFDVKKAVLFSNRGSHICKSMLAYKKFGRKRKPNKKTDHFVGEFYMLYEKKKRQLEKELLPMLQKWESRDRETIKLWKLMDSWAISGFKQTYKEFGSRFDVEFLESDFFDKAKPIIEAGLQKKVFYRNKEGTVMADLDKQGFGKKAILRKDGTSIYITNDLALTKHKFEKYKLDKSLWVVGSEQNLYFQQLFKIFELLGFQWHKDCTHLSYGLIYLPEGKMKSREGRVVDADDIIKQMADLAKEEILKREQPADQKAGGVKKKPVGKDIEKRAKSIGLAALKYFLLKTDSSKDMHFRPAETIPFEGNTGPYIQYTHARACSILEKAEEDEKTKDRLKAKIRLSGAFNACLLKDDREKQLIKKLTEYPKVVMDAGRDLKPYYIANYLFNLATMFNEFYHAVPVLGSADGVREARIALVRAVRIVLKNGLGMLNIEAPEKM
jgi:arginyl-tRNA synthetase